jgi:hypothetical protein
MNEFSNEISKQDTRPRTRRGRHPHHHDRGLGQGGSGGGQDARRHERGEQIPGLRRGLAHSAQPGHPRRPRHPGRPGHPALSRKGQGRRAVHELHAALADVARTGDEQLRGEAAQILADATSRLNRPLAAGR